MISGVSLMDREYNSNNYGKKNYINMLNNKEVIEESIPVKYNTGMSQRHSLSPPAQAEERNDSSDEEKKRNIIYAIHLFLKDEMHK